MDEFISKEVTFCSRHSCRRRWQAVEQSPQRNHILSSNPRPRRDPRHERVQGGLLLRLDRLRGWPKDGFQWFQDTNQEETAAWWHPTLQNSSRLCLTRLYDPQKGLPQKCRRHWQTGWRRANHKVEQREVHGPRTSVSAVRHRNSSG